MAPAPLRALYVHWPWCLAKCPYCDFNSAAVAPEDIPEAAYAQAIAAELAHYARQTDGADDGPLTSLYVGGGTPSLMRPETLHAIIEKARALWGLADDAEITVEANPTSVEVERLRGYRDAGANRVSLGIQALNDTDLRALGREHTVAEARAALDVAATVFDRYTFDLIYARPGQSPADWACELDEALRHAGGHLSLYQLSVEPGTAFFRERVAEADPDLAADLFKLTRDKTGAAGLPAYEISNHARPGQESRHNLAYWQGADYIGVGPGAHGRLTRHGDGGDARRFAATHQIADPARWLDAVRAHGHGTAKTRRLSAGARTEELVMTGLRLTAGLDRATVRRATGLDVTTVIDADGLKTLIEGGLITWDDARLRVTDAGLPVLNAVLARLLG